MTEQKDKVFAEGMMYKEPHPNAPDFVKGSISIKVDEFKAFLDKHVNDGWVNLGFKKSKGGKLYFDLDTWKPEVKTEVPEEIKLESIPF